MFLKINHVHFIGIGGSGMSGIAELLHNLGYKVSGSDVAESENIKHLQQLGIDITMEHLPKNITSADVIVYSSAIQQENIELQAAHDSAIPVIRRAEMLAELMRMKYGIAIAGTHGKTTTTSLVSTILAQAKLDPTIVIGGRLSSLGSNAYLGKGDFLVAEADESDGSFLKLSPTIAVVTTLDEEHMEFYGSLEKLKATFLDFINKVPFYGAAILCLDQGNIQDLIPGIKKRFISYGLLGQTDLMATRIEARGLRSSFDVIWMGKKLGRVHLNIPGIHNIYNSLAAIGVSLELDVPFKIIKETLGSCQSADRRFQIKEHINDIYVVDDYGHHPTEIKATLATGKGVLATEEQSWNRRLIVVFQPHRYTRTRDLLTDFYTSFYQSDILIVTDIYPAGEKPIEGVNAELIADGVKLHGHRDVRYIPDKEEIPSSVIEIVRPGDMILTLGAGSIWKVNQQIVDMLKEKFS